MDVVGVLGRTVLVGAVLLATACGGGSDAPGTDGTGDGEVVVEVSGNNDGTIDALAIDGWPSAAPTDVPPFPGHVESLMTGRQNGSDMGARIFLSGVSTDAFEAYLGLLLNAGYAVQGIVYYSDNGGAESGAQARADRGEYDAVRATKGPRRLTITVPSSASGEVTYDLDGLTLAESDAMNVGTWPSSWTTLVPQPDDCSLDGRMGVLESSDSGFHVACTYASSDPAEQKASANSYVALLESRGYVVTQNSGDGYSYVLEGNGVTVRIYPDMVGKMDIQATRDT